MAEKMMEGLLRWIREYRGAGLDMVGERGGGGGNRVLAGGDDGGDAGGIGSGRREGGGEVGDGGRDTGGVPGDIGDIAAQGEGSGDVTDGTTSAESPQPGYVERSVVAIEGAQSTDDGADAGDLASPLPQL